MKRALLVSILCAFFVSSVWAQSCPTCPATTHTNQQDFNFSDGDVLEITSTNFTLGNVGGNIGNGETAYLCVANGASVGNGNFNFNTNITGTGRLIIINNGTWTRVTSGKAGVEFNNCGIVQWNSSVSLNSGFVFNNYNTVNVTGNFTANSNSEVFNAGTFNIGGNFINDGSICGPTLGCGLFNVDGTTTNNSNGDFGVDAGGTDCGYLDVCNNAMSGSFNTDNGDIGTDVTFCHPDRVTGCGNILPVTFLYFKANKVETVILTQWATTSETNNAYFSLEKSHNGFDFQDIGRVEGAGSTEAEQTYQFLDTEPYQGTNYYRLRQVDIDGTTSFSQIAVVHFRSHADLQVKIYPNPNADDLLSFEFQHFTFEQEVFIRMTNLAGKVVQEHSTRLQSPTLTLSQPLPQGIYLIQIRSGNALVQKQYVKY